MTEHHFTISKTVRYFTHGDWNPHKILIVLHGHAQLPKYFIRKFENLIDLGWFIVAPEGLHRFYTQGHSGRVGASWMTSEDRLSDIQDYLKYLNQLSDELNLGQAEDLRLLGFSQGVATGSRWLAHTLLTFKQFIICSGMIATEFRLEEDLAKLGDVSFSYISGTKDPFLNEAEVLHFREQLKSYKRQIQMIEFNGVHEIHLPSVQEALNNI